MYNPKEPQALGGKLVDMAFGFADGIDSKDLAVAMETLTAGMAASDELKDDTDAAIWDMVAGITSAMALRKRNPEVPSAG
jgi:hypothetical protein